MRKHWSSPDQGKIPMTVSAGTAPSTTAKIGLLQALLSHLLPVTKMQAEVILGLDRDAKHQLRS